MAQNTKRAKLFVCASCEWIFKTPDEDSGGCPKCHWAYYGAHYVYGNSAYRYYKSQEPWKRRKLANFEVKLNIEIDEHNMTRSANVHNRL